MHSATVFAKRQTGVLALEDGRCFHGVSVGYEGFSAGEVVFNTSMTGYQEMITDPASAGQIVAMTTPHIGNTGINPDDYEITSRNTNARLPIRGLIMREMSTRVSNWRATESLPDFLKRHQVVALSEVDTRSLTQHLQLHGTQRGIIAAGDWNTGELIQKAQESPPIEQIDFTDFDGADFDGAESLADWETAVANPDCSDSASRKHIARKHIALKHIARKHIVVINFGIARSVLQSLASQGVRITLVPALSGLAKKVFSAEEVLQSRPDGIVLSGGPGDPRQRGEVVSEIKKLIGNVPVFAISLGHQILGRVFGASVYKLPFGHRGAQPVLDKKTGRVVMTEQNHSYCLVADTLPSELEVSYTNLQDNTIEGFRHRELPIASQQFYTAGLFEHFLRREICAEPVCAESV